MLAFHSTSAIFILKPVLRYREQALILDSDEDAGVHGLGIIPGSVRTIPGDEAFQPLATSRCPAVTKK